MSEKKETLNNEGGDSSDDSGDHTLEKNVGKESPEDTGQSSNEDKKGSDKDSSESGDDGEELVEIPKSELSQIKSDRDNYKEGMLKYKRGEMDLPSNEDDEPKGEEDGDEDVNLDDDGNYITKDELQRKNEQDAIAIATNNSNLPGIEENWDKVMEEFDPDTSRGSVMQVLEGIKSAYKSAKKSNPDLFSSKDKEKKKKVKKSKKARSDLSSDSPSTGSDSDKSAGERSKQKKKKGRSILPNNESMDGWYSDNDN